MERHSMPHSVEARSRPLRRRRVLQLATLIRCGEFPRGTKSQETGRSRNDASCGLPDPKGVQSAIALTLSPNTDDNSPPNLGRRTSAVFEPVMKRQRYSQRRRQVQHPSSLRESASQADIHLSRRPRHRQTQERDIHGILRPRLLGWSQRIVLAH